MIKRYNPNPAGASIMGIVKRGLDDIMMVAPGIADKLHD